VSSENLLEGGGPPSASAPKKKKKITDTYEFGSELGRGAYSVVKLLYRRDNRQSFACKILDNYSNMENAEEEEQNFQRETSILKKLNHPNVVRIYDVFKDRERYYVVLENVAGGELFNQLMDRGFYTEADAAPLARQMFSALAHIHGQGFAHRDIKPENLLFSDDTYSQLKIVDFGEAKSTKKGPLNDYVGTPDYMAPEVVRGSAYTCKVDCWSSGVVVYILLCGFPPFEGESEAEVYINVMNLKFGFPSPDWDSVSEEGKSFIRALLTTDEKRMSAEDALKHPWMLKFSSK
jgi:serine/threonine protein kinase